MIRLLKEIPSKKKGLLKEIDHKVTDQGGNWDKAHQALGGSSKKKIKRWKIPPRIGSRHWGDREERKGNANCCFGRKVGFFFGL